MSVNDLITLFKVGGLSLVLIALLFVLLRFVGNRFVKALDDVATRSEQHAVQITASVTMAMREIANSVTQSTAAHVQAIGVLTDRVSRMEGVVAGLGLAAVNEARAAAHEWHDEGDTPLTPVERPQPRPLPRPLPKLVAGEYGFKRPGTERGEKKKP